MSLLYTYEITGMEPGKMHALIHMDASHSVYKGHFPGFPVTPGVYQVRMIREILEKELGKPLLLQNASQIKFIAVHEPASEPEINASISYSEAEGLFKVEARLHRNEKTFLKLRGEFREQK